MLLAFLIWFFPWYSLGFVLLAFLPRWYLLLPGGALALAFNIGLFAREADHDIGKIVAVFLAVGFSSGFLVRALILVCDARISSFRRPLLVLPIGFVGGVAVFLGYIALGK